MVNFNIADKVLSSRKGRAQCLIAKINRPAKLVDRFVAIYSNTRHEIKINLPLLLSTDWEELVKDSSSLRSSF